MLGIKGRNGLPLLRLIAPAFPAINVFSRHARKLTPLGPIMVATSANRVSGWRAEVIDENNYRGPRDHNGLPDHKALQEESPAFVIGLYCGLTSTMERVFELAGFYKSQGAVVVAGGWHVHYCPDEALDNGIDVVVHGDGEIATRDILKALSEKRTFAGIPGISFWDDGRKVINSSGALAGPCLDGLPYPDFGLLKYARGIKIYPIGRIRGCRMNCDFCSVKGAPRWASAEYLFGLVNWLVATRGAERFFVVDDRSEEDPEGTISFFRMISQKYGDRLRFTVQIRLEAAKKTELLEVMKAAGVKFVCVGYESPIDEDLIAMRKGLSSAKMLEWTRILRHDFWVHGMFIFGYPARDKTSGLSAKEMARRFRRFIRKARLDSVQVLHAVPIVGSGLRDRLEAEKRILPLELAPWSKYDGNWACSIPDANMTLRQFQETPMRIMKWFYNPFSFFRIGLRILAFPADCLVRGWNEWRRGWLRDLVKSGGHILVKKWQNMREQEAFLERLERRAK